MSVSVSPLPALRFDPLLNATLFPARPYLTLPSYALLTLRPPSLILILILPTSISISCLLVPFGAVVPG